MASYLCLLPELPEGQDTTYEKEVLLELLVRLGFYEIVHAFMKLFMRAIGKNVQLSNKYPVKSLSYHASLRLHGGM